jgi:hypothetical protein
VPTPHEQTLAERYGRPSRGRSRVGVVVVAVLAVALGAWAIWAAIGQTSHAVSGIVRSYRVVSPHQISVSVQITRQSEAAVRCTVRAVASDHSTVGETVVTVPAGHSGGTTLTVSVKTERLSAGAAIGRCRERS